MLLVFTWNARSSSRGGFDHLFAAAYAGSGLPSVRFGGPPPQERPCHSDETRASGIYAFRIYSLRTFCSDCGGGTPPSQVRRASPAGGERRGAGTTRADNNVAFSISPRRATGGGTLPHSLYFLLCPFRCFDCLHRHRESFPRGQPILHSCLFIPYVHIFRLPSTQPCRLDAECRVTR